tara:strand:- start:312 stop:1310 length:999 start_codon:yes stop_codon:yes gene_type:complete
MSNETFPALLLKEKNGEVVNEITDLSINDLPEGEVTVKVEYSTVNYKDGMVVNGLGRLVRHYPHVPGIDFAGIVEISNDDRYKAGDKVVLTGWHVGERYWGGYSAKVNIKADWLVPLPKNLSTKHAMAIGTAGFTSMLCILTLEKQGLRTGNGPVLVTGASGGVGSIAIAILSNLGYEVCASTGKNNEHEFLKSIGASEIFPREDFAGPAKAPLNSERWAGAVDTVGANTLANVLSQMKYGCSVAACGLAGGSKLDTTVIPFLLRGVNLLGIDSVVQPHDARCAAWKRISSDLPLKRLDSLTQTISLRDVPKAATDILNGSVRGRLIIDFSI